jgi:hypothetical protein
MSHAPAQAPALYGLMAEFDSATTLFEAAQKVRAAGFTKTDAYSPFPIHGLAETLGFKEHIIPKIVLGAGITGALAGYGLEFWTQAVDFPMNIGGRPYFAWVSFIPPAFETTILFAAFSAVISMIVLNGLPQPYHPVFNAPRFERASQDGFFLAIEATDPKFDTVRTREFLTSLHAREVVALDE